MQQILIRTQQKKTINKVTYDTQPSQDKARVSLSINRILEGSTSTGDQISTVAEQAQLLHKIGRGKSALA